MLSPHTLEMLTEQRCSDLRRECEAERLIASVRQPRPAPSFECLRWPKITLPRVVTLRRRHVSL